MINHIFYPNDIKISFLVVQLRKSFLLEIKKEKSDFTFPIGLVLFRLFNSLNVSLKTKTLSDLLYESAPQTSEISKKYKDCNATLSIM